MMLIALLSACSHGGQSFRPEASPDKGGAAAGAAVAGGGGSVQVPERSAVQQGYKWRLADLYADEAAWRSAKEALQADFGKVEACRGKLGDPAELQRCLDLVFGMTQRAYQLSAYANRLADEDTRQTKGAGMKAETQKLLSGLGQQLAFIEPELLALPEATFASLSADERLKAYRHYLDAVNRQRPHTLSRPEEELLAQASLLGRAPENVYDILTGSDLKFDTMTDSAGDTFEISIPMYMRYRSSGDRDDRKKIFDGFWALYTRMQNTFSTLLAAQVERDLFFARVRKYDSSLAAALDGEHLPTEVYTTMVDAVNEQLPLLHRYLKLRRKLLGVERLEYHDMYAPLIPAVEMKYSYEEAIAEVSGALAPLGPEYVKKMSAGMAPGSGWIDVLPTQGKRTGAYMSGSAYAVHPYVLLNFQGRYDDVSTLAHEMGHAMHSHLTNSTQPFHYADYATFIAEIASTFNEALLMRSVLAKTTDKKQRLYLLGEYMETFRTVVFRQALFAEFELAIHRWAEQGKPLTAAELNRMYRELLERYYGHAEGVAFIQDRDQVEWAYIPHFYYNYYVFSYVTGFISATALAEKAVAEGEPAVKAYLGMLERGSSDYPLNLLKDAGVDMTSPEPYRIAAKRFEAVLDEVEKLSGE